MTSKNKAAKAGLPALPSIAECEAALDWPAPKWKGYCHTIACRLIECGLVTGHARYGFYYGPVATGSYFSPTAPFHRHGWIELPDRRHIVDPTRWVFEDQPPYLFLGPYTCQYDPGMQRLRWAQLKPCPGRLPGDQLFDLNLSPAAAQHLSDMTGFGTAFSYAELFWIANLPIGMLGVHCTEIFKELARIGHKALIPIDNWQMAMTPGGPPKHALRIDPTGRAGHDGPR
jgi:hypothetical protein